MCSASIFLATGIVAVACAVSPDQEVERAFAEARRGNLSLVSALARRGPGIVPDVARYLTDSDEGVRREAVGLLGVLGGAESCRALVSARPDPSQEIRERAAARLYGRCAPAVLAGEPSAGPALRKSLELGSGAAASFLLLGYFPGPETTAALASVAPRVKSVKLESWMAPVPAWLAASVALARIGAGEGQERVLGAVSSGSLPEQEFLLSVLREIENPLILRALSKHLSDRREIAGGVPSGATPRRRLCDLALNAFATKLNLQLSFQRSSARRYTDAELDEAKQAMGRALGAGGEGRLGRRAGTPRRPDALWDVAWGSAAPFGSPLLAAGTPRDPGLGR